MSEDRSLLGRITGNGSTYAGGGATKRPRSGSRVTRESRPMTEELDRRFVFASSNKVNFGATA